MTCGTHLGHSFGRRNGGLWVGCSGEAWTGVAASFMRGGEWESVSRQKTERARSSAYCLLMLVGRGLFLDDLRDRHRQLLGEPVGHVLLVGEDLLADAGRLLVAEGLRSGN